MNRSFNCWRQSESKVASRKGVAIILVQNSLDIHFRFMYRQHLKMARGEGETTLKSHFVERVVRLPMVHVAWDLATNTYTHLKESNRLVNFTLTNAEKSVTYVAGQAKPVVLKFEKQIQAVDSLACLGLGTLEEKVPFIKKPAEEIIGDTRKLYEDTVYSRLEGMKKLGNDTVKSAADFGLKQATAIFGERVVQSVLSSVDDALVVTQHYVDHYLPPSEAEKKQNNVSDEKNKQQTPLTRLTHITNNVRQRAYRAVSLKIEYVQEKSIEIFVVYPITVVELTKANYEAALQYATKLWTAILEEDSDEKKDEAGKSKIEKQLLQMSRLLFKQVASTYSSLVPLQSSLKKDQEPSKALVALSTVTDRILWALGILRTVPQLLPMYLYGLVSWLEEQRKPKEDNSSPKQNGTVPKENNHVRRNNVRNRTSEELTSSSEHLSDSSIPEEDEEE